MSVPVLSLDEKIVTDTGQVVFRHTGLVRRIQNQEDITDLTVIGSSDVERLIQSGIAVQTWIEGEPEGIDPHHHEWNIPSEYRELDWIEYLKIKREEHQSGPKYDQRFEDEISMAKERGMEKFIRATIYVVETLRENNVTLGVGRGSSCASFLLYLIGVHRIDPVLYDIPAEEFFK